jgi:Na+-translocating ferredoxin:NAD+ oxidoreductase RnfD subunit
MANGPVVRFFKTPKGLLLIVLIILTGLAAQHEPLEQVGPLLISAVVVAGVIDIFILRKKNGAWEFPSGAMLTGLIIAMIPELAPMALVALFAAGVFIADRVNKIPMVLIFLWIYYLLFTLTAYLGNPAHVAEIYRAPDLHAVLYFTFFILTDPPTSPVKYPHQLIYGAIVAVTSYAFFQLIGAVYYLLAAVLVGNLWEAGRRWYATQE